MKRFISIITLLATLGFALPTPVEARDKDRDRDRRSEVIRKKKPVVVAPVSRAPRLHFSNRYGPMVVHPPVRRHVRRGLFDFVIRL